MGIQDLYKWVKKTNPGAIKTIRNRFADPRIRGKRIAIDATLLTNKFHFGRKDPNGKQALVGWYEMIREMRAADVKPIAIWDQRGIREWKAAEAKKRLSLRALAFARRNHEMERQARLKTLRSLLTEFQSFPADVQGAIRNFWKETLWKRYGPILIPSYPPPEEVGGIADSDPKIGSFIERVDNVLESFEVNYRAPRGARKTRDESEEIDEALKHVRDLEVWTGESAEAGSIERGRYRAERLGKGRTGVAESDQDDEATGKKEEMSVIDQKLQEMLPDDAWGETPTQMVLTQEEGAVIDALLGVEPEIQLVEVVEGAGDYVGRRGEHLEEVMMPARPLAASTESPAGDASKEVPEAPMELRRKPLASIAEGLATLDTLIDRAPVVHEIYARQLALPTKEDHEDCRELLIKLGVPVLTATIPYEAEGLASSLAKNGLVDFVGTEDSDVLGYEAPLLRHIGSLTRPLAYIDGESVRTATDLSPESYLDFCILLGTDASPRIKDVGPTRAFKLIAKHGNIESVLEENPKIEGRIPEGYMDMVVSARQVFMDLPPVPDALDLEQGYWKDEDVERWLEEEHGVRFETLNQEREGGWVEQAWGDQRMARSFTYTRPIEVDEMKEDQGQDGVEPNWEELVREVMADMGEMEVSELEGTGAPDLVEESIDESYPDGVRGLEDEVWEEVVREEMRRR